MRHRSSVTRICGHVSDPRRMGRRNVNLPSRADAARPGRLDNSGSVRSHAIELVTDEALPTLSPGAAAILARIVRGHLAASSTGHEPAGAA